MYELKIKITDINRDGYDLHQELDANFVEFTVNDHLHFIKPFDIKARFDCVENVVVVKVNVQSRYQSYCYRSLVKVERDLTVRFHFDYELEARMKHIDITEDVRQEIILSVPMRILSDKEVDKNRRGKAESFAASEDQSGDDQSRTHKPFAGLKDIE